MGTDIHAAIEYQDDHGWHSLLLPNKWFGKWKDEPELSAKLHIDRNYDLFAILGNVRNGRGFAGIKTSDGFNFISDCRGVPEDCDPRTLDVLTNEHSPTWITLREILEFDWTQTTIHEGVVTATEFEEWERMKAYDPAPKEYCGEITDRGIKHVSNEEMRNHVREKCGDGSKYPGKEAIATLENNLVTRISWEESYTATTGQMWTDILPPMLKLGKEYGYDNVRLVMDFDS